MAQSVARRLGSGVGGSSPLGSLMKIDVPSKSSRHSLAATLFLCKNRKFFDLFIQKEKSRDTIAGLKKGGKVYMKKLFALYAYNIGEKCE